MRRIGLAALFLTGCIFGPCQQNGPPPPDKCDHPTMGSVSSLEIGPAGATEGAAFVPWKDGDVVQLTQGGQGSEMTAVRLHLTGADVPSCVDQTTRFLDGPMEIAVKSVPLTTYPDGDGRSTTPLWIPASFPGSGQALVVHVEAAGQVAERTLFVGFPAPELPDQAVPDLFSVELGLSADLGSKD
jgi:hypothetical protein